MRLIAAAALLIVQNEFSCSAPPLAVTFETCSTNAVTVQVTSGGVPTYRWTPSCGMSRLIVYPDNGSSALWTVYGDAQATNPISSGVRYGQTPDNGRTVAGPERLQHGVTYRVEVSRLVCEQGALCILVPAGTARFQP
jgi:hypothetical protein